VVGVWWVCGGCGLGEGREVTQTSPRDLKRAARTNWRSMRIRFQCPARINFNELLGPARLSFSPSFSRELFSPF
jgi:hypothetical protein